MRGPARPEGVGGASRPWSYGGGMRRVDPAEGLAMVRRWRAGQELAAREVRLAVRFTLEELASSSPGGSVEVRVPPAGVVQAIAGPRHTRGTPPNIVETDPQTWLRLAVGLLTWDEAASSGALRASGTRADLSCVLPVLRLPTD